VKFTPKQAEAQRLLGSQAEHIMLFGGSRSGKTFLLCRAIAARAIKAPGSRHAILRFRYNAVVQSVALDTMPKVFKICYPELDPPPKWQERPGWFKLQNGSEIWLGGLDDKERTEKILGLEFATIFLNECSQIPWQSVGLVTTRLAQNVNTDIEDRTPAPLKRRQYYDCNPPSKSHWTYKLFIKHVDPDTNMPLPGAHTRHAAMQMNPLDNVDNLPADYIEKTLQGLSQRLQKRFLRGEFADATPNALFADEIIDRWRHIEGELPDMQRIVVGVDPSGSGDTDNADNDAIGIVVGGLGIDGNAYLLEDCTVKAGPQTWGNIATTAYERHRADMIVGEVNFGGAMVQAVITAARPRTPYKPVSATRGKVVRAEPFSALYEQGKIRHAGYFQKLEDELSGFSTIGYTGSGSPNRADAWVWVLTELFPGMVNPRKKAEKPREVYPVREAWLA
jgi:phage terminase large subunit-like protein